MTPLVAFVGALALYRLTLLVVADSITAPPRDWLVHRLSTVEHRLVDWQPKPGSSDLLTWECACGVTFDGTGTSRSGRATWSSHEASAPAGRESKLAYLLECPWCASVWLAGPVAWSAWCFGDRAWWFVPALALAASGITGALATAAAPD